jgi:hypothetical protein
MREAAMSERSSKWFSLAAGDGVLSMSVCGQIEARFAPIYDTACRPAEMAVFKRHDFETSMHCEVRVYFSPAVESLARAFGAKPCAKPPRAGLELVAGESGCWQVLFA